MANPSLRVLEEPDGSPILLPNESDPVARTVDELYEPVADSELKLQRLQLVGVIRDLQINCSAHFLTN